MSPLDFDDELFQDFGNVSNYPLKRRVDHDIQSPDPNKLEQQKEILGNLSAVISREWPDEAEASTEVVKMPTKLRWIICNVMGMDGEIGYDPSLGINII